MRTYLSIQDDGAVDVYCRLGAAANLHNGMRVLANGGVWTFGTVVPTQNISCISAGASGQNVLIQVGH